MYDLHIIVPLRLTLGLLTYIRYQADSVNLDSFGARADFLDFYLYYFTKPALDARTRYPAAEMSDDGTTADCVNLGLLQSEMLHAIPFDTVEAENYGTLVKRRLGTKEKRPGLLLAWGARMAGVMGERLSIISS